MKRRLCFVLALGMSISLVAGCGGKKEDNTAELSSTEAAALKVLDFKAEDYVELGDYMNLSVQYPTPTVAEEDVEYEITDLLDQHTEHNEITGRPIQSGDYINIDFKGTIDGEEFDGGSSEGYEFTIGNGEFLEDFEANVLGKNTGDNFTFNMTFPEDYDEELGGKEVQFEVTVNSISESVQPEYTDEFVAEVTDYDSIAAYEESVREELMVTAQEESELTAGEDALLLAVENSTIDGYPQELYDSYYNETVANYQSYAEMFGMDYDEFMAEFMGEDGLEEEVMDWVNDYLVCKAIAEKEGFDITEKNFEEEALALAQEYEYETVDDFVADYGEFAVIAEVLRNKAIDFLYENAEVEEVSEEEYYGEEEAVEDTEVAE